MDAQFRITLGEGFPPVDNVLVGPGLIGELRRFVAAETRVAVICDQASARASVGQVDAALPVGVVNAVRAVLETLRCSCHVIELPALPVPDERTIGTVLFQTPADCELLIGCGSGTIIDVTRYLAFRLHLPFVAVPTAASVDGFTSSVSPLIVGGVKTTVAATTARGIIADTAVLAAAPARLNAAGFGDLLGKCTAAMDWLLAHHLMDEDYNPAIDGLVRRHVDALLARAAAGPDVAAGSDAEAGPQASAVTADAEFVADTFRALVVSGLAITFYHNSRPASGSEHHISHFLETMHLAGRMPRFFHGETVALGTVAIAEMYHEVFGAATPSPWPAVRPVDRSARVDRLTAAYGPIAPQMIAAFDHFHGRMTPERVDALHRRLIANRPQLSALVLERVPTPDRLRRVFARVGVLHRPRELGVDASLLKTALICAKEIRDRFSILSLLDALGLLETVADTVSRRMCRY